MGETMKISQEQKGKTRSMIVRASVDVITEKGFKDATMHEIAKRAKVAGATIYGYFPTKESIVYGYFEDQLIAAVERLKSIRRLREIQLSGTASDFPRDGA